MAKNAKEIVNDEKLNLQTTVGLPVIESAGGLVCNRYHHM